MDPGACARFWKDIGITVAQSYVHYKGVQPATAESESGVDKTGSHLYLLLGNVGLAIS